MSKPWRRQSLAQLTWPLAALVMILLMGCQSTGGRLAPDAAGWQVVERTGEARLAEQPGRRWSPLDGGDQLAVPGLVATGPASRLVLRRGDDRLRLGPSSRVVLLAGDSRDLVEQQAGVVDYRIMRARIRTPHGIGESASATFRIEVGEDLGRTAFAVGEGALHVATADGTRGVTLRAGQRAEGRDGDGPKLAFTRTAGAPLEAVPPAALPVAEQLPPARAGGELAALAEGLPERHPTARSTAQAQPPAPPAPSIAAGEPEPPAAARADQPIERIVLPAAFQGTGTAASPARPSEPARPALPDDVDRFLDGLLEGLERAPSRVPPER